MKKATEVILSADGTKALIVTPAVNSLTVLTLNEDCVWEAGKPILVDPELLEHWGFYIKNIEQDIDPR